jgi:hypothetical protein
LERLDAIDFDWSPHSNHWEVMFSRLVNFKSNHGHCNVNQRDSQHGELAQWVSVQRRALARGKLKADRAKRLAELGFDWNRFETRWNEMLEKLKTFKRNNGHWDIPNQFEGSDLRGWVSKQREAFAKGTLSKERVLSLDAIGFEWSPKRNNRKPETSLHVEVSPESSATATTDEPVSEA